MTWHILVSLFLLKGIFSERADGAYPIFGNIFPCSAGSNSVVGITDRRVVNIPARTNKFFHVKFTSN